MKIFNRKNYLLTLASCLLMSPILPLHAESLSQQSPLPSSGRLYVGVFGGSGWATGDTLTQQGTAFYADASGGPLAVDAFGNARMYTPWFVGAHIGYQLPEQLFNTAYSTWGISPAAEFEGYYLSSTAHGDDINNDTSRAPEHDFSVHYPMNIRVFLINGVLDFNLAHHPRFHPYVGLGFGTAIVSVVEAISTQTQPPEVGINHYNSETNSVATTFAAQPKLGLRFDITKHISAFAEYRFLYLANTNYTFGSTVYATHVPTAPWLVRMGPNYYNFGAIGLEYSL